MESSDVHGVEVRVGAVRVGADAGAGCCADAGTDWAGEAARPGRGARSVQFGSAHWTPDGTRAAYGPAAVIRGLALAWMNAFGGIGRVRSMKIFQIQLFECTVPSALSTATEHAFAYVPGSTSIPSSMAPSTIHLRETFERRGSSSKVPPTSV